MADSPVEKLECACTEKPTDVARLRRSSLPETMIEFAGDRPGHDFRYSLHCEKIHRLGWRSQVSFEEGLQRTVDWYRTNEWWWRRLVRPIEPVATVNSNS